MTKPIVTTDTVQDLKIVEREVIRLELTRDQAELIFSLLSVTPLFEGRRRFNGADVFELCDAFKAAGLKHNPKVFEITKRDATRAPWLAG
jgi:hypothetical protein